MTNIEGMIAGKSPDFIDGFETAVRAFAYWAAGEQYVGSCGTTLESVLAEIHNYRQTHHPKYKET